MCWRIEGGRGRLGASMSSELNRMVDVVVRGKTGSARLCLRLRRPPPPLSPSLPASSAPPPIHPVPAPALPPPPPPVVAVIPPLRRPTKAGTLMRNREFREADDLPVGNGLSAGCGPRNGTSGDNPRGEMGDVGVSGEVGTGEMDMTPLYPLEGAANGVAELIEGDIGISKIDEANVNARGRRGRYGLLSTSSPSPSRSTDPRIGEFCTIRRRFIRLRCHHTNKNIASR
jgi:hypothetical protein